MQFYWYEFADGYRICCAGFSVAELRREVLKHGAILSKTPVD